MLHKFEIVKMLAAFKHLKTSKIWHNLLLANKSGNSIVVPPLNGDLDIASATTYPELGNPLPELFEPYTQKWPNQSTAPSRGSDAMDHAGPSFQNRANDETGNYSFGYNACRGADGGYDICDFAPSNE